MRRNMGEGLEEIKKIKECVYEGYRYNLFMYNKNTRKYTHSLLNYDVDIDSNLIRGSSPLYVIVTSIMVQPGFVRSQYKFVGTDISILDGYVDVDTEYARH